MTQPMLRDEMAGVLETVGDEVGLPLRRLASFRWSHRFVGDAVVIHLAGEMDLSTAAELRRLLEVVETDTAATIVLDMSEVSFIDAHSIGVILHAWTAAEVRGQVLQVDRLRGLPARVVRLLGLESTLCAGAGSPPQRMPVDEEGRRRGEGDVAVGGTDAAG